MSSQQGMAERVREFTELTGYKVPDRPQCMDRTDVQFVIAMCCSELVELAQTVCSDPQEAVGMVRKLVATDLKDYTPPSDPVQIMADQADAAVDAIYYLLNAFTKKGSNLDKTFDEVHRANMDKRFPDGTFHRREDGKIIKPPGFKEADIKSVILEQNTNGSWA